jgi:hypothetical protein
MERSLFAFVKLTDSKNGTPVYLDVNRIRAIDFNKEENRTEVYIGPHDAFGVKESPEVIFERINEAFAKLNAPTSSYVDRRPSSKAYDMPPDPGSDDD